MSALAFELPEALEATEPPEARGLARDEVRLMVARRGGGSLVHARFRDLPEHLAAGDVLVINTSATLPAAIPAQREDATELCVHVAMPAPGLSEPGWWVLELRSANGARPFRGGRAGDRIVLLGGVHAELVAPYAGGPRLWLARVDGDVELPELLAAHGHPIRYGYVHEPWPLEAYQAIYALHPGSAEMPSAGRPFTSELLVQLVAKGVQVAPVVLHTGLSSPERHEPPFPERYEVPAATAELVNTARGRVVAVGTTVVRALETVASESGQVRAGSGWTKLVITPERGLRAVDGLITGWHEPEASHLQMLEAAAGPDLLRRSYRAALRDGYRWHEFGDSHLVIA